MGSMSQPGRRWSLGFVGVEGLGFRVYGYGVLAEFVLVFLQEFECLWFSGGVGLLGYPESGDCVVLASPEGHALQNKPGRASMLLRQLHRSMRPGSFQV